MTAVIDQRVVQMAFQNSDFERNASTSISTLDKLKKSLNFSGAEKSFDGITQGARNVNLGPIADGLNAVSNRFSAMGVVGIGILLNITNAAIEAGKKIFNALAIEPIKAGLNEYETKLNSVQTILANTQKEGTNLKQVTDALNQLNDYSDKTIYNFQQMTRNVGTFTAAGVKLDASVAAIKGIANLAAVSGSNADQASTAMYQLSQALSSGTVKLMDWNSVVNAGMGGQVFQDSIMETARVHGVAIDDMIAQDGSFRETLQRGWFTSEILTETLQKFTGDLNADQLKTMGYTEEQIAGIIKMGQVANDAATKVKTFSQLFNTLKEAAQSGWAQTWEIIIGDFEEAKTFLTELNNWFGGMIGASADARNQLLQGWSDLGGRTKLIEAFQNAMNALVGLINPIKEGMREIFPPITAENLMRITEGIAAFTKGLIPTAKGAENIKRIFKGVFSILDIGKMIIFAVAKEFGRLLGFITPVGGSITDLLAKLGDFITRMRDTLKANDTFGKIMRVVGNTIALVAGIIGKAISAIIGAVERFRLLQASEGFLKAFVGAISTFFGFFKNLDFSILEGFIERIVARFSPLGKLGDIFKKSTDGVEKAANPFREKLAKIADNIKAALSKFALSILDKLSKLDFSKFSFKGIFDSLNAGLLSGLLLAIWKFVNKGTGLFGSITDIFKGISGFAENANGILAGLSTVLTGVKDIFTAWQQQIRAGILLKIASAIAILAVSLIALSLVDSEKLTTALAAVTLLFADLMGSIAVYEKLAGGVTGLPAMAKAITAMLGVSAAVLLLSIAMVKLSRIPSGDMVKGVLAIAALSTVLILTSKALAGQEGAVIRGVGSMILFSIALLALTAPLKTLANMELSAMTQGLIGLGVLLAEVAIFMRSMNFKAADLDDVLGMLVLSAAISQLSNVIKQLGALDASTLTQGMTVLGILLTGLAGFTKVATGAGSFFATAAGMLVLSGAMAVMAEVLKKIGSMSVEELAISLAGLGGSLLIMSVALNAMTGGMLGAATLLVAAGALAVLVPSLKILGSMSLEQVGIGLLAMAGAFTVLGLAGLILTPVVPTLLLLAVAIAGLGIAALGVGVGIGALAAGLALLAALGSAGGAAIAATLLAIAAVLPLLAAAAALAIVAFARVIKEGAPVIFEAGQALLLGFIKSMTETMPQIIEMILTGIDTFLAAVAEKIPSIVQSGYDILLGFLRGIRDNIGQVTTVSGEIITTYINALAAQLPAIVDSAWNFIISWIDAMKAAVAEHMPELITSIQELGVEVVKGLVRGLFSSNEVLRQGIKDVGQIMIDAFKERLGIASPSRVFIELATQIIAGLVQGLLAKLAEISTTMTTIGNRVVDGLKDKYNQMVDAGRNLVSGFASGIRDFIDDAVQAAQEMASSVVNAVENFLGIQSPSTVMMGVGKNVDEGFAQGITAFAGRVVQSTQAVGDKAIDGFTAVATRISDVINSNLDFNPTITPVLDMSSVTAGGSALDSLFGTRALNLAVAARKVASISVPGQAGTITTDASGTTPVKEVNYIQNNYSPTALSRIDIYRQTKNQLALGKDLIGAQ